MHRGFAFEHYPPPREGVLIMGCVRLPNSTVPRDYKPLRSQEKPYLWRMAERSGNPVPAPVLPPPDSHEELVTMVWGNDGIRDPYWAWDTATRQAYVERQPAIRAL